MQKKEIYFQLTNINSLELSSRDSSTKRYRGNLKDFLSRGTMRESLFTKRNGITRQHKINACKTSIYINIYILFR